MQSPCSKINQYHNSNNDIRQFIAAKTVLTKIKRDAITSLPETFFLTFPDNLWNLWFVDVQFWFWTKQQTLQGKLRDDLTEIIRRASALSSLEEGKEVSSLWSHSVHSFPLPALCNGQFQPVLSSCERWMDLTKKRITGGEAEWFSD